MQTPTELAYENLDKIIKDIYASKPNTSLRRQESFMYAGQAFLKPFPSYFMSLESSKTWTFFWNTLTIKVVGGRLDEQMSKVVVQSLKELQYNEKYQGWLGFDYIPHLASTYAAVHALCNIATEDAYKLINVDQLLVFFVLVKQTNGGFLMHVDGELDVRGTYCVLSILDLLQVHKTPKYSEKLTIILDNVVTFLQRCQTHQGGFGSIPGLEAHGGYTHCAYMSLEILERWSMECCLELKTNLPSFKVKDVINISLLRKWCALRVDWSGGITGRTNKLVDVCYSFWIGSLLMSLNVFPTSTPLVDTNNTNNTPVTIHERLQQFIAVISASPIQDQASNNPIKRGGGFRDKPHKGVDYNHTSYALAGWSCFQQKSTELGYSIIGGKENELNAINKQHNSLCSDVDRMKQYFASFNMS